MNWTAYTRLEFATATRAFKTWVKGHLISAITAGVAAAIVLPVAVKLTDLSDKYWELAFNGIAAPIIVAAAGYLYFLASAPVRIYNGVESHRRSIEHEFAETNNLAELRHRRQKEALESEVARLKDGVAASEEAARIAFEKLADVFKPEWDIGIRSAVYFWVNGEWPDGEPDLSVQLMSIYQKEIPSFGLRVEYHDAVEAMRAPMRTGQLKVWGRKVGDKSAAYLPIDPEIWATVSVERPSLIEAGFPATNLFKEGGLGFATISYYDLKFRKAQLEAYRAF